MKILGLLVIGGVLLISGCQPGQMTPSPSESSPSAPPTDAPVAYIVPESCDQPSMISAIEELGFENVADLKPEWDPGERTDLKLAIDNGGLVCAWGPAGSDSGVYVYWVKTPDEIWNSAKRLWREEGASAIDVPGLNEIAAYYSFHEPSGDAVWSWWELNARFDGLWIHVATYGLNDDPAAANSVVEAALEIAKTTP